MNIVREAYQFIIFIFSIFSKIIIVALDWCNLVYNTSHLIATFILNNYIFSNNIFQWFSLSISNWVEKKCRQRQEQSIGFVLFKKTPSFFFIHNLLHLKFIQEIQFVGVNLWGSLIQSTGSFFPGRETQYKYYCLFCEFFEWITKTSQSFSFNLYEEQKRRNHFSMITIILCIEN